jgi:hypothetical protein
MRTLVMPFVALTGHVCTNECEMVAVFVATEKSGLLGGRTSSDRALLNGKGSVIKSLIRVLVFH